MKRYLMIIILMFIFSCDNGHKGMLYYPEYEEEVYSVPDNGVIKMQFFNENEGWIVVNGRVYRTEDGCLTWEMVTPDTGVHVSRAYFVDMGHGWCYERYGKIYYYNGEGWELSIDTGDTISDGGGIKFYDGEEGWCMINYHRLWHYYGGKWDTVIGFPSGYGPFSGLEPVGRGEVFISNFMTFAPPVVIHYKNGVFQIDTIPCDTIGFGYSRFLPYIGFSSPDNGWGIGIRGNYPYLGHIYRYRNGKWELYMLMDMSIPFFLEMLSPDNGWIALEVWEDEFEEFYYEEIIMHWDGREWNIYYIPTDGKVRFYSCFVTEEYLYLGANDGHIIRINIENWR